VEGEASADRGIVVERQALAMRQRAAIGQRELRRSSSTVIAG
jgi:hypothetical protein